VEVVAHDPYVRPADWERALGDGHRVPLTKGLDEALDGADCAAIVTKHREYFELTPEALGAMMRRPVVVDGRNVFPSVDGDGDVVLRAVGRG
jgi:UDP-N-acetyl-D-mannosaminuronate dehydrogenase